MNVFFAVQGTLLSSGHSRLHLREAFLELVEIGHQIYLWSSARSAHVTSAARLLSIEDLMFEYFTKSVPPTVLVDDQPDFAAAYGGYAIPPFGGDPDDEEL